MSIQVNSLLILALFVLGISPVYAQDSKAKSCFDFSKKWTQLPPSFRKATFLPDATLPRVSAKSGHLSPSLFWAAARGQVGRPIQDLLQEIAGHETLKSPRVSKMEIKPQKNSDFLIRQQVDYTVTPFLFVKVSWKEEWAFNLLQGTKEDPKKVEIIYEKTDGTSHIKHLCGAFVLDWVDPKTTDVSVYEEVQATNRTEEDTIKGLIGTIRTFRYGRQD